MASAKADRAKMEHIVGECLVKAANVILSSRIDRRIRQLPKPPSPKRLWFNLEVAELDCAQDEIQQWRHQIGNPLIIEISQGKGEADPGPGEDQLMEVWSIVWDQERKASRQQSSRQEPAAIYKRLVILLRSLFTYVRILPAYKTFKACKRQGGSREAGLDYTLRRSPALQTSQREGSRKMRVFDFTPIETPYGTLKIGVKYWPALSSKSVEHSTMTASTPRIIPDYMAAQQPSQQRSSLSASLSGSRQEASDTPAETASQGSALAASPILRRHSWSLSTARSQSQDSSQLPAASALAIAGKSQAQQNTHTPGPAKVQGQGAHSRGAVGSSFAPHTPSSAGTPPKYPSGGLAARVSYAAFQTVSHAASRLYPGQSRSPYAAHLDSTPSSSPAKGSPPTRVVEPTPQGLSPSRLKPSDRIADTNSGPSARAEPEAAVTGLRSTSKPVVIPGCQKEGRKPHSSSDLCHLGYGELRRPSSSQQAAPRRHVPASAPAAQVYLGFSPKPMKNVKNGNSPFEAASTNPPSVKHESSKDASVGVHERDVPAQPSTPPVPQALPTLGSVSDSSPSSSFPASCSPQLPFAFTPSNQSYTSAADPLRRDSGLSGLPPTSPTSNQAGSLAVVRRPSWSIRSSSYDATTGGPGNVGYSVSPVLDSLGSSLFSETPRNPNMPLTPTASKPKITLGKSEPKRQSDSSAKSSLYGPPRLTLPTEQPQALSEADAEADLLPFAIDREASLPSPANSAARAEDMTMGALSDMDLDMSGLETEADAAVGAFVRLIQEAPDLRRSRPPDDPTAQPPSEQRPSSDMSLQAGLDQLAILQLQLSQMAAPSVESTAK